MFAGILAKKKVISNLLRILWSRLVQNFACELNVSVCIMDVTFRNGFRSKLFNYFLDFLYFLRKTK